MPRFLKAGIGAVLALVLAFGVSACGDGGSAVFASVVEPVETTLVAPQYAAQIRDEEPQGRVVRLGEHTRRVPSTIFGVWLNDGRFLVSEIRKHRCPSDPAGTAFCSDWGGAVLDPRTGLRTGIPGVENPESLYLPDETLHRVNLSVGEPTFDAPVQALYGYSADLSTRKRLDVPDDERSTGRTVHSIGDWDYTRFSIGDEESAEHRGYLRRNVNGGGWEEVLVDQRLTDVWVSRDGSALLGVQQNTGELCDACDRAARIVEIDPNKGKIVATYGAPAAYDKTWKVAEVDKVDDRVLVRYVHTGNFPENLGVWQYDGSWDLVPGTDGAWTWWQGEDDRIEIKPVDERSAEGEGGIHYDLYWLRGDQRTRLAGQWPNDFLGQGYRIPGSLVPLA